MYVYKPWSFIRNLHLNTLTNQLTKSSPIQEWNARAYLTNAFTFDRDGIGFRVFHNTNEGESTKYAVGISNDVFLNNIVEPLQLNFGLYFEGGEIKIVYGGQVIFAAEALNVVYHVEYEEVGSKLNIFYEITENDILSTVQLFSIPAMSIVNPYSLIVLAHTATNTPIDVQSDDDGIKSLKINDVVYYENDTEVSVYSTPHVSPSVQIVRVKTSAPVKESSITKDSIKIFRFLPEAENPDVDKVLINYTVPYLWNTSNYFDIFIPEFLSGYIYQMVIGTSEHRLVRHVFSTEPETPFELKTLIFRTEGTLPEIEELRLNNYLNDIYFKARHLSHLIDIDSIVYDVANVFDYEYKVREYDPETDTYSEVEDPDKVAAGLEDTALKIKFENSKIIESLFVSQYLPEYDKYMRDINDPLITIIEASNAQKLKELLFKNITLLNYFKGDRRQMNFLISVFSSSIGYYYVSVDPDPYRKFVYRVSTSLPKKFWTDSIKDITHPLGWSDLYIHVPRDATSHHQMKVLTEEQFEVYWETHSRNNITTYVDVANYLDETGKTFRFGTYTENAMESDLLESNEFPFKPTEYSTEVDFGVKSPATDTSGLFHHLRTEHKSVSVDENQQVARVESDTKSLFKISSADSLVWDLEFLRSGIATVYLWKVYRGASLIHVFKTFIPKLRYHGQLNEEYRVVIYIKVKAFEIPLYEYHINGKEVALQQSYYSRSIDASYLDLSVNKTNSTYNGVPLDDIHSHKEYKHHDSNYEVSIHLSDINNIINNTQINWLNFDTIELFFNNLSTSANFIHGIFSKYEWEMQNSSGDRITSIFTNVPKLKLNMPNVYYIQTYLFRGSEKFVGTFFTNE